MSIEAMQHVWKTSRHKGAKLLVLLAIADHAHPDGTQAYPSVATLARMGRTTERHITRILTELEESKELLIERHAGPRRTHRCTIPMVGSQAAGRLESIRRPLAAHPGTRARSIRHGEPARTGRRGLGAPVARRDQTAIVRAQLMRGVLCGRWAYLNALPNGRTRAGDIARRLGMQLASDLCAHREPGDPSYHDYALAPRQPVQQTLPLAIAS